jgi:hypothetical protein
MMFVYSEVLSLGFWLAASRWQPSRRRRSEAMLSEAEA